LGLLAPVLPHLDCPSGAPVLGALKQPNARGVIYPEPPLEVLSEVLPQVLRPALAESPGDALLEHGTQFREARLGTPRVARADLGHDIPSGKLPRAEPLLQLSDDPRVHGAVRILVFQVLDALADLVQAGPEERVARAPAPCVDTRRR